MHDKPTLIALDWGTTSLRAYLMGAGGAVRENAEHPLGILNVRDGDFSGAFQRVAGPWRANTPALPALASGMIGSRQGWREAAYVECPAGLDAIARGLLRIGEAKLGIAPGVSLVDADGVPDVMRGEETQILGAFGDGESGIAVLPGTHSKWVLVEGGRIQRFATFMTGEAFAALSSHTILGRLFEGQAFDPPGFARGVAHAALEAKGRGGLLRRLFSARTLGLFGKVQPLALRSYLSGLLIGSEIEEAASWLDAKPARVTVIGGAALAASYQAALKQRGIEAVVAPTDAAARGLWRIASAAGMV
ncbi:MAG: 2-dehydro-3-deoxygalactonokinase [Rhodospirillales bacterium]